MTEYAEIEERHSSGGVARRPVVLVRGEGARLFDQEGREYLDLGGAHGWASLGHSHPAIVRAIAEQSARLIMQLESSYNDQRALWFADLAAVLREHLGQTDRGAITRIHPCNSGAEAVEAALKFARKATGRTKFVALLGGFHGRTLGALSATGTEQYRKPFEPLVPGFTHVAPDDVAALRAAVTEETAAVVLEIIQGEAGVRPLSAEFLRAARRRCDETGALLIIDEIQTGLGRTGRWFACEHFDLAPDVVVLGKALGGGIPMGAAAWREGLGKFDPGTHGSTFGGNPLACAASRAALRVIREESLPQKAAELGTWAMEELRSIDSPVVEEVRGRGLMIGIALKQPVTPILKELMSRGVWAIPAGRQVLRLLPPLTISRDDLERGLEIVKDVLEERR
ncbi:[LysW]-aminoadipate semialdehyde transaminase [bacterium HR33]|nr:[LysW]-aminoadipate semialdehyde transaminase [bacterium HR33]